MLCQICLRHKSIKFIFFIDFVPSDSPPKYLYLHMNVVFTSRFGILKHFQSVHLFHFDRWKCFHIYMLSYIPLINTEIEHI